MAKLYFRHGTVGCAKSLNLLAVAHTYSEQHKKVISCNPKLDDRFGVGVIKSRAGIQREALVLSDEDMLTISHPDLQGCSCVLIDEAQFLSPIQIEHFRKIADSGIPVICYGLRTDFRSNLFPGSKRLLELADVIEEVKSTCRYCNRKSVFNAKIDGSTVSVSGDSIDLGEDKYRPCCSEHYFKLLEGWVPDNMPI